MDGGRRRGSARRRKSFYAAQGDSKVCVGGVKPRARGFCRAAERISEKLYLNTNEFIHE